MTAEGLFNKYLICNRARGKREGETEGGKKRGREVRREGWKEYEGIEERGKSYSTRGWL